MWPDVVELRDFYASPLGGAARQLLTQALRRAWPDAGPARLAGYGFANPYLDLFRKEARSSISLMPAAQGFLPWPDAGANRACLVEEERLPLSDLSLDRLLIVHALEHAERPNALLREAWRVLDAEGHLLIAVPNRRGLWARIDRTPFGWGQPFSRAQVTRLLNDMLFEQISAERCLFLPPTDRLWLQRSAQSCERLGARFFPRFGGVLLIEARKRLVAPAGPALPVTNRRVLGEILPRLGIDSPGPDAVT
ncbi:MAG: methyltransferase domain-containing protein [Rhodospirillales bacterium]|nr:methyltransferase domain-containing protein [Rhodospirillales bacterium]